MTSVPWRPLKYAATINDESLPETTDPDFELAYIDISNVDSSGTIGDIARYSFASAPSRARRIVRHGDVIISTVRTYLQAIAAINDPPDNLIVSTGFAVIRPLPGVLDAAFCKYALRESRFLWEVEGRSVGVSYPAVNSSELGAISIPLPPLRLQCRIANYLDSETAEIDALIAEKRRMLALLEEKRAALVSRAVTRGLDPHAPLKPSGLDWIGEIPAHWQVMRLRWAIESITQGWSPLASNLPATENGAGVLKLSAISRGRFFPLENKALDTERGFPTDLGLRRGDVLVTRSNTPELVGDACSVPADFPSLLIPDLVYRLRLKRERLDPEYLASFLLTPMARTQIRRDARGSSGTMIKLSQEHILNWMIPVPPLREQRAIVECFDVEGKHIKQLTAALEQSVTLLGERRSALITAAVTGQLTLESTGI
jgi:type I restriction enzyme S subunit